MSLDRPKTRKDTRSERTDRGKKGEKGLRDSRRTLADKKTIAAMASDLKLNGTIEGNKTIESAVTDAGRKTDEVHKEKVTQLTDEVLKPGRKAAKELSDRSAAAKSDAKDALKAASRADTKPARVQLEAAGKAAEQDAEFLMGEGKAELENLIKGETEIKKQGQEIRQTKVSFRR